MEKKLLIDAAHPEETRVVVAESSQTHDFDFESNEKAQITGNIYLAKVTRVEPSLQAAFLDYGGNRHGFLAFSEIHPDYYQIPLADKEALLAEQLAAEESFRDNEMETIKEEEQDNYQQEEINNYEDDYSAPHYEQFEFAGNRSGSGFIVGKGKYVITNYHVIHNAEKVAVRNGLGKVTGAKVINFSKKLLNLFFLNCFKKTYSDKILP